MQSISNRVSLIDEGLTADRSINIAQSATVTMESSGEQRTPTIITVHSREEQSTSTQDTQVVGNNSHTAREDRDNVPDYDETIYWEPIPDSDDPDTEVQKLSPTTTRIVEKAFSCSIANDKRRSLKRKLPTPDTPHTTCPKFDPAIQMRLSKHAKEADRNLARCLGIRCCNTTYKHIESSQETTRDAAESAQLALGNSLANISMDRCRKASTHLNPELTTIVENKDSFKDSAPLLFGSGFIWRQSSPSRRPQQQQVVGLFRGATPPHNPGRWHVQGQRIKKIQQSSPDRKIS